MKTMTPKTGAGFGGVMRYNLEKNNGHVVGGNMAGENARDLSQEFQEVASQRPDIKKPVWHGSLSMAPGETVSDEKAQAVAEDYLREIGMDPDKHQWVLMKHEKERPVELEGKKAEVASEHYHIVANRISYNGEVWKREFDLKKSIDACQKLEKTHGLIQTQGRKIEKAPRVKMTKAEIDLSKRLNEPKHSKEIIAEKVNRAMERSGGTKTGFYQECRKEGVNVKWNEQKTGRISGVSYKLDKAPEGMADSFKGSALGKGYSIKGIEERLDAHLSKSLDTGKAPEERSQVRGQEARQEKADPKAVQDMATKIDKAISKSDGTRESFTAEAAKQGVTVKWNEAKTGRISGARFEDQASGQSYKGSELGDKYKWGNLSKTLEGKSKEGVDAVQKAGKDFVEWGEGKVKAKVSHEVKEDVKNGMGMKNEGGMD